MCKRYIDLDREKDARRARSAVYSFEYYQIDGRYHRRLCRIVNDGNSRSG